MFAQLWQVQQISDEAGSLSVNCGGCLHQRVWVITLTCFLFKISLYDHLADVPPPLHFHHKLCFVNALVSDRQLD